MTDEPLFALLERIQRALQDAVRFRQNVEERTGPVPPVTPPEPPPATGPDGPPGKSSGK